MQLSLFFLSNGKKMKFQSIPLMFLKSKTKTSSFNYVPRHSNYESRMQNFCFVLSKSHENSKETLLFLFILIKMKVFNDTLKRTKKLMKLEKTSTQGTKYSTTNMSSMHKTQAFNGSFFFK